MTRERAWPRPDDDHARVAALHELGILDRPHDAELAGLTRLASYVCGTPAAVLNLVDEERQVQVAAHGFAPVETSRDEAMCGYSILSREVTYTPDASRDAVFADNPFVTGELADVRLYASAPVVVDDEHVVGTICAFASEPAQLEPEQLERLRDLADAAARILELRRSTERLALAATRDPLTGLPNRAHLDQALPRALARQARALTRPGLVYLDLDGFKPVNDRYGHAAGDEVLREVARRLLTSVRASDLVARLGGDEFVVLVEESPGEEHEPRGPEQVAERVRAVLAGPFELPGGEIVRLGASVGHATADDGGDSPDALLERADAAMYADKAARSGGGGAGPSDIG